jgi:hypothetical protein
VGVEAGVIRNQSTGHMGGALVGCFRLPSTNEEEQAWWWIGGNQEGGFT